MSDPIALNRQNWDDRAAIHARDTTGDYRLDRFRAGEDALHAIEAAELGDIAGKRVLHLQCHIGRDTLCLAHPSSRQWTHSLSSILGSLIDAGLAITMFREHEVLPWQALPSLVPASDGLWRLADGAPRIPLSFSLRAKKAA
ncbi:MAG TPA: hypothetical protein VMF62_11560 [Acetobacteraceae bacterium]|jgi:hypothetical protein|nr:hypothetical protein [Acetobacteraceae bacterium]